MAFWTTLVDNENDLQPKMADRFVVIMGGTNESFSQKIIYTAKSVSKPSIDIETKDFKLMNHKFKYPGIATWNPIKITFVDMAGTIGTSTPTFKNFIDSSTDFDNIENSNFQNTAAVLAFILHGSGYDTPSKTGGGNTGTGKAMVNNILESLRIQQLDHTPDAFKMRIVEEWTLFNPIVKSITWGDLAYGEDSLVEYSLEIDYDFAQMSSGGEVGGLAEAGSDETPATTTTDSGGTEAEEESIEIIDIDSP